MAQDYASMRAAIDRIMGTPGGGGAKTAGTQGGGGDDVQLAPRAPFSDISNISNVIPEVASQAASAVTPVVQQAAAAAAPVLRNSAGLTQAEFEAALGRSMAATPNIREPEKFLAGATAGQFPTAENWTKYHSLYGFTGDTLQKSVDASMRMGLGSTMQQRSGTTEPYSLNVIPAGGGAAAAAPLRKPTNPGPRAPWQASAQYWKDLDAYRKAGGV